MANTLSNLKKPEGATSKEKRVGRGVGSGLGKTAGRGQKGQYARNGIKFGFEGGQTPLYRRLPKRGFTNPFPKKVAEVNVSSLEVFAAGTKVDAATLWEKGLVKGAYDEIKILGNGKLSKAVTVTAHAFSKSAAEKIQKAGGKVVLVSTVSQSA
ncbi:MAG: 50S ribosomal protein L15 [Polyangiaceae bacterium]|nr:50S ribosomal protein L15 [Polyangiaceae bacterium]